MCAHQGVIPLKPAQALKRLVNVSGLYSILGETIMDFMELKPQPYGLRALKSREDFWNVDEFKRGLTFVFLLRYVLGFPSQRMWKRFKMSDFKFNTRCFKRWLEKEADIFSSCKRYNDMPEKAPVLRTEKRRGAQRAESLSSDSPFKRHFVVADESTSEDEL